MNRSPIARIVELSVMVLSVIAAGTLGYRYLLGWGWLDSLYMTSITISTVGFGEVGELGPSGRVLTILIMLAGAGVFAYAITTLASTVLDARFGSLLWRRRMERSIEGLSGHFVVCGYGRTGRSVVDQLRRGSTPVVVVETKAEHHEALRAEGILFVEGDATSDSALHAARIDHAGGLIAALGNDAENVYLVLSARQLNPHLTIAAWASNAEAERKVLRAGANHAISPYVQGGRRLATLLTAPHALAFVDHALDGSGGISLGEIAVPPDSKLAGNSLKGAGIRRDLGVIVIGIRRADGTVEFNPAADEMLNPHDVLIGIGAQDQIEKLRRLL